MIFRIRAGATFGLFLTAACLASAQSDTADAHTALLEWVRTEKLIAAEATDWQQDQAVLQGMIDVLARESAQIESHMSELEASLADSTAKIEAIADQESNIQADIQQLAEIMPEWEIAAQATADAWPAPLQQELPPLPQLNAQNLANDTWLTRIPAWIARLQLADAFNNRVTVHYDLDEFADGKSWEVREIYYGLGGGFWVTTDSSRGGSLEPSNSGWLRRESLSLAPLTNDMIAIAERRRPSAYLLAPVSID